MDKWLADITMVSRAAMDRRISLKKLQELGLTESVALVHKRAAEQLSVV
jgi:hypothetical protein